MDPELRKKWQDNVDEHFSMQYPSSLSTRPRSPSALDSFKPAAWYREPPKVASGPAPEGDGPFQLLDRIGTGGMGVVYGAHQRSLARRVAVKTLKSEPHPCDRALFEAEAHTIGMLEHPNIVPIYDLGETAQGDPFLAMKLVEGRSWREVLWGQPTDLVENLETLLQVCNAVAFAHSKEIVHNDIKPSNVMLGDFGEVLLQLAFALNYLGHSKLASGSGEAAYAAHREATDITSALYGRDSSVLEYKSQLAVSLRGLGACYEQQDKPEIAVQCYRDAEELLRDDPLLAEDRAKLLQDIERLDGASDRDSTRENR